MTIKLNHSKLSKKLKYLLDFGLISMDKPTNLTSHQVAEVVKNYLSISKAGHSGTLDPKVTGVLPVALNRATKIMEVMLKSSKAYVALMHLHKDVPYDDVINVINKFEGKIEQLPPVRCAVKRQLRTREIYSIKLLDHIGNDYLIEVYCEAGTYIRKLLHDIGETLGIGAHMQELRRIKASCFTEYDSYSLQQLEDAIVIANDGDESVLLEMIKPISFCISDIPILKVVKSDALKLIHGMALKKQVGFDEVAIYFDDFFIGLAKCKSNYVKPHRIYFTKELFDFYIG